jgi:hypothetical protein
MSTEPYPEVSSDDESGIVPPQGGRTPEWPKKIRTLTAAELDRLTIDSAGRFYWDGRLVNYEPPQPKEGERRPTDAVDRPALEIIERATYELGEQKEPEPIEGADLPRPVVDVQARRDALRAIDFDVARSREDTRTTADTPEPRATVQTIRLPDRVRVSLSFWQSLGALLVVLAIMLGASGMAAYGLVAAHDWGCRIGVIKDYCPPPPAKPVAPPPRSDIPA